MPVVPCSKCPKRGCGVYHEECEPYQEFVKARKAYNDEKLIHQEVIALNLMSKRKRKERRNR